MTHPMHSKMLALALVVFTLAAPLVADAQSKVTDSAQPRSLVELDALNVIAVRIAAYNAHTIDAFLAAHSEQVEIYVYPDKRIGVGHDHLTFIFESQFERGAGLIQVKEQFALGNRVVSHEIVTVEAKTEYLVAIYTVEDGVITSYRLIEVDA